MIKVQDWIASIPDEEKHIAYVGEGKSEQRTFLLCGEGWETYKSWSFHLDMAFDTTSITTRDSRQVVQTTSNSTERMEETGVKTDAVTTKESYTVENVQVNGNNLTDVTPLSKTMDDDGIRLTWSILRQHTTLPGKLWATIRAVDGTGQCIKKSAIMVFEVDPAVCAVPATVPPTSEFEQMMAQMDALREQATQAADQALHSATNATTAGDIAFGYMNITQTAAQEAQAASATARQSAQQAAATAETVAVHAAEAERLHFLAANAANSAADASAGAQAARQSAEAYAATAALSAEGAKAHSQTALNAVTHLTHKRVNVRDYGAVGDGVTDDRQAIINAFAAAKTMLPCEVYFPSGTYGISNGITIYMDYGTGGLRVRGAGRDTTTIQYLDSYNPRRNDVHWYALRIWPVGMPGTQPTNEDEYLHDISYMGFTVHDPDPCAHATHASKGDSTQEETHGVDLHYCKGVSVTDCQFITVGDEAIDICNCRDVIVMNNRLIGSPGAGPGGGAISINDGCNGVVVSGNTINGSAPDETLENGTVITKKNNGITVESLSLPVQNVTISGNAIRNMHGVGVKMYTTIEGTGVDNIIVANNVISGCDYGIITEGTILKNGLKVHNNLIADCSANAMSLIGIGDISVCGNTFRNIGADKAVKAFTSCGNSTQLYADNLFENIGMCAMYVAGNVFVKDCVFNGVGTTDTPPVSLTDGAIQKYSGVLTVSGCSLKDIRLSGVKNGINNANYIEHTDIELISKSGTANAGGDAIIGADVTGVIGGRIGGRITIKKDRGVVRDVTLTSSNIGDHAITISANYVTVTGCNVETNKVSTKGAIGELSGYNHNLIANNITNQNIITVGANTVAVNNLDTRVTA